MTFLYFFQLTAGIVCGTLFGIAAFIIGCLKVEEWYLDYEARKWERKWMNR